MNTNYLRNENYYIIVRLLELATKLSLPYTEMVKQPSISVIYFHGFYRLSAFK